MKTIGFVVLLALATACSSTSQTTEQIVTVEGTIEAVGNEPFVGLMLTTPDRNAYMLRLSKEDERLLYSAAPTTVMVSGIVFPDLWGTGIYAWLDVRGIEFRTQSSEL